MKLNILQSVLLVIFITIIIQSGYSQINRNFKKTEINFTEHSIDEDFGGASALSVEDIDKDGRLDVICGSEYAQGAGGEGISWWKNNTDGTWSRNIIDETFLNIMSLQATDINDDGNTDILISDWGSADEIAYFTSDNNNPPNWTKNTITSNFTYAHDAFAADIDNNGLLDVAGVSATGQVKVWYQSTDKSWNEQTVDGDFSGGRAVYVIDIDNDEDFDIIAAAVGTGHKTVLYLNEGGNPIAWTSQIIDNTDGGHHIHAFDFDKDGDNDILISVPEAGEIFWWKNQGGNPILWEKETIANLESAGRAVPCDFDNDEDYDILGSGILSNELSVWYNQGGQPFSWTKTVINNQLNRPWPTFTADIDDDGDFDFVAGASESGVIRWWENDLYTNSSIQKNDKDLLKIVPNPANKTISIYLPEHTNFPLTINLYDISGKLLKTASIKSNNAEIDISDLPAGVIFLKIYITGEILTEKLIKN